MTGSLDHFQLWTGLLGGLALFLFGMDFMTRALKAVAGERMKDVLASLTRNRFMGALTGAVVTGVINSSSVTTVIMVGFISAGLVTMAQCVSVIMGANIGTTVTAQILAFKVTKFALPMVTAGFVVWFVAKDKKLRQYGAMVLGLGMVFYGMAVMSDAMKPLRTYQPFLDFMIAVDGRIMGIAIGAAFTALVQSSSATTGIVIVMASQGLVTLPAAIAIAFGANIGTCVTALLASIGKPREAVRASLVHVLFNVAGVLLWVAFIPEIADLVTRVSPPGDLPRQVANAHTLFNVANTLIFLGFTTQIARVVEWLVPERPAAEEVVIRPRYLDDEMLATPPLALEMARREMARLARRVRAMVEAILPAALSGSESDLDRVAAMDQEVDVLRGHIVRYLGRVSLEELEPERTDQLVSLLQIANQLEHIGDIVETNMVTLGLRRISESVTVSPMSRTMIERYHAHVLDALDGIVTALEDEDLAAARRVRGMKADMATLVQEVSRHEAERLAADEPNRLNTYTREMETIENLTRIFRLSRRMAKALMTKVVLKADEERQDAEEAIRRG